MFKVGILGASSPQAGEIIRILINHPEIEIISLYAPNFLGRNVSSVHHGLIGEQSLTFSDKVNLEDINLLFITEKSEVSQKVLEQLDSLEDLYLISLSRDFIPDNLLAEFEIGLSEINRKALVRGAKRAWLPSPAVVSSLVALVPLAQYMLLNSDIGIEISLPSDLKGVDVEKEARFMSDVLKDNQASFGGKINLNYNTADSERSQSIIISLKSSLPLEEIEKVYDQIYDDHNFAFLTLNDISTREVEGTQKIVMKLEKPSPDILNIHIVSDARLRGGAGDAIHVMNLFFGLHEKTGLNLKPSRFSNF